MANTQYWKNDDGLNVRFNARDSNEGSKRPGEVPNMEFARTFELAFEHSDLPITRESDVGLMRIPAGAYVKNAFLVVDSEFTEGVSLTVGLRMDDDTEIDDDGIFTADELAVAELEAGAVIKADAGDLIGSTIGSDDGYIVVVEDGEFESGTARLIVEFLPAYDGRLDDPHMSE